VISLKFALSEETFCLMCFENSWFWNLLCASHIWSRTWFFIHDLDQSFPTWDTCTPRGTFAYLKGYIKGPDSILNILFLVTLRHKNGVYLYSSESSNQIQWISVILLNHFS